MRKHFLKRLDLLAYTLEKFKERKPVEVSEFDIRFWFGSRKLDLQTNLPSCQSAACALGTACFIPEFRKAGLTFRSSINGGRLYPIMMKKNGQCSSDSLEAAVLFFGITYSESAHLFLPNSYNRYPVTPKMVANRIRKLIKKYQEAA